MGSTVAVVIFRVLFCFKLNLGDCGSMGVGRFFFLAFFFFFLEAASSTVSSCNV